MNRQNRQKKVAKHRILRYIAIFILIVYHGYILAVYSPMPFIAKWRTIYIETAMSTMTHHWLATYFIPPKVINTVMEDNAKADLENLVDDVTIELPWHTDIWVGHPTGLTDEQIAERSFFETYKEIDFETLPNNLTYKDMVLTEAECEGIKTVAGDDVYLIDTVNGITVANVHGSGYVGKIAIIKNPKQVYLAKSSKSYAGQKVLEIAQEQNAAMAINASGFVDPNGQGNGGTPVGLVISQGELLVPSYQGGYWFNIGFDFDDNLRVGTKVNTDELRDAVQFKPAIIIDGEVKVSGSAGWGIQPRTVLAQTSNKEVIFLAIDGRKPGYSIGTTVGECAEILLRYGAVQAVNLDGGASTALTYYDKTINVPCAGNRTGNGRSVPNAWVVSKSVRALELERQEQIKAEGIIE